MSEAFSPVTLSERNVAPTPWLWILVKPKNPAGVDRHQDPAKLDRVVCRQAAAVHGHHSVVMMASRMMFGLGRGIVC